MIKLRIDGQECDLGADFRLPEHIVKLDMARLGDLNALRQGHSVEVEIPSSPCNDSIMCYPADAKAAQHFNQSHHEAQIEVDGATLMQGVVHLVQTVADKQGASAYHLRIYQGGEDWMETMARKKLSETDLEYEKIFSTETIEASWTDDVAVRFLPLHYDSYTPEQAEATLNPLLRIMTVDDYHPFLSVEKLTKAIFAQAGYQVESQFMESEEFKSLLISGKYASVSEVAQSRLAAIMGFEAGRSAEVSATASNRGMVWLSPASLTNSTGNFVNTTEGEGLYNSNGVFSITEDRGMWYYPKTTQIVGFEYEFRYKTPYTIVSPSRLAGFDSIYLGENADFKFELPNPFKDCRDSLRADGEYVCRLFADTNNLRLRLVGTAGRVQGLLAEIHGQKTIFTVPTDLANCSCELQIYGTNGAYTPYEGEWAIYESYVEEDSEIEVAVKLRTPAEEITPATGKSFNGIYIYGAQADQRLTLLQGTRLRAVFSPAPALGTTLRWTDIAPKDASQLEFIDSIRQMFNLRFITSDSERKVYIEPLTQLLSNDVKDWRDRVICSDKITVQDSAKGISRERLLGYRAEVDGAVGRFNDTEQTKLGEWEYRMTNRISTPSLKEIRNALFSPTLTAQTKTDTPSAMIMQVGDRDAEDQSLTTRIVSYRGMKPLPTAETWGFPSYGNEYPYATFHDKEELTLCFEDRDGQVGLHRYYDEEWQEQDQCSEVELSIRLQPYELELLCDAESTMTTLGSLYLLNISGEEALYRLQAIESYDKERAVARCRFRRTLKD